MIKDKNSVEEENVDVVENIFDGNPIQKPIKVLTGLVGELESGKIKKQDFADRAKEILNRRLIHNLIPMAEFYAALCDKTIEQNEKFHRLYSIINVVCCCVDVVRQYEKIQETDINIHPMNQTVGEHPERLLESVTKLLNWTQETVFPYTSKYRGDEWDDNERISVEKEYTAKLKVILSSHNELNIKAIKQALDTLDVHYDCKSKE